jgi:hypothetical protein
VTIRAAKDRAPLYSVESGVGNNNSDSSPIPTGSIAFWDLDTKAEKLKLVDVIDYYKHISNPLDLSLAAAYSAWDIQRNALIQILVWNDELQHGSIIQQRLELRYGLQSCSMDMMFRPDEITVPRGVCFAGIPGDEEGACIRILFRKKLVLYEPFRTRKNIEVSPPFSCLGDFQNGLLSPHR